MTNKNIMIFQTALRKYVDKHEKSKNCYFFCFYSQISKKESLKLRQKMRKNFILLRFFFEKFTNSKIKVRSQIIPKIDKNYFWKNFLQELFL
jgi:hypothetical protein